MIIKVKGTRSDATETTAAERYAAKAPDGDGRAPHVFGAALVWLGLYLRSIFPAWGQEATPPLPQKAAQDVPAPYAGILPPDPPCR